MYTFEMRKIGSIFFILNHNNITNEDSLIYTHLKYVVGTQLIFPNTFITINELRCA